MVAYYSLQPVADFLTYTLLRLSVSSHIGASVAFFFYDAPKVMLLLVLVVFVIGVARTFITPERTRRILAGKREFVGNIMAASLGIFTPFCSCSACPLFIGFVEAGIPLGVTLSFLIASPMINEVALVLLYGMFGWRVALIYVGTGLVIAILAGWIIGRLKMERHIEDWVREMRSSPGDGVEPAMAFNERLRYGRDASARNIWQDLALPPGRYRRWRGHTRLHAGGHAGHDHG
jgi:uncharacterized membrane protein YraQ (UPF0718 family)